LEVGPLQSYGGFFLYRSDSYKTSAFLDPTQWTHLEFATTIGVNDDIATWGVSLGMNYPNGTYFGSFSVQASSGYCSNDLPVTNQRWSVIRVPISMFNLNPGYNILGIYIYQSSSVPLLEGYLDGIQFASYTTAVQPIPNYNVWATYNIPQDPTYEAIPGVPNVPPSSSKSVGVVLAPLASVLMLCVVWLL